MLVRDIKMTWRSAAIGCLRDEAIFKIASPRRKSTTGGARNDTHGCFDLPHLPIHNSKEADLLKLLQT